MLERDVREQHDPRVDHVGRVEAAPEAGLHGRRLDAPRCEVGERGGGQHLELRRSELLRCGPDTSHRALEACFVGVEPLVPARYVWRGVRGAADRPRDPSRRRRLALRPDDVHRLEGALRIPKPAEQRAHPVGAEAVHGPRRERPEPVQVGGSHRH